MSQLPEIPSSAYTPEMNTLGAILDIPIFEGEPVPVSRNPLTSGTRPLQLLPLPGTEFPVRYETNRMRGFQTELLLTPWEGEAWRTYPSRAVAELYTQSRLLLRGYWVDRYYLGERVHDIQVAPAQQRVPHAPPCHMCLLEGMTAEDREEEYEGSSADSFLSAGDYATYFSTRMQARLPEVLEYTQERKKHRTVAHYRAKATAEAEAAAAPAGPAGVVLGDVPFPPGMEVVLDPALGLGSATIIPADLRQAPPPPHLDPEHATHVPAQRYQELCQRFEFARSFIGRLYSDRNERAAEALVSPVRCYSLTPDGGGSASDEARGGGDSAGRLRGGR
ncbi:hypothetical protein JCGZ_19493 [Jatropha curcas]|uniref:Uncharacterized protein n=1 Tax=Jatropha curcas TaxID=180498 RepID=A0A067LBU3_JATCU|nr:hypothetical protein JCGZ_19493 [Jatropha curcas]